MLNPATRKATGYYAALGITVWDVHAHGFTQWNLVALLVLAGVAGVSGLAELIRGRGPSGAGEGPTEEG